MDLPGLATPPSNLTRPTPQLGAGAPGQEARVAQEFEAMVLNELFGLMFQGLSTDGPFGGGAGEAMFRPMLIQEYAKGVAASGGVGLGDAVLSEITRLQMKEGGR